MNKNAIAAPVTLREPDETIRMPFREVRAIQRPFLSRYHLKNSSRFPSNRNNPFRDRKTDMTMTSDTSGGSPKPLRVLLVDDSIDAAEAMSMLIETLGHEVRMMHDGPSALAMVDGFAPEVVILDIGLPGMSGFDVAREMRAREATKKVLMIALTGYGGESDRREAQQAGFDHHLVKPVSFTAIENLIAQKFGCG
jgi:two-component system, OmpR family, response regulator